MPALLRSLLALLATLWLISMLTFAATSLRSPQEVAQSALGRGVAQEQIDAFVEQQGLEGSLPRRYGRWLGDFVTGDWGTSPITQLPVAQELGPRLRNSLILAVVALLLALPPSIAIGLAVARRRGGRTDVAVTTGSVVLAALPEFVVGVVLMWLLAVQAGLLPVDSSGLAFGGLGEQVEAFALPALTLALVLAPQFVRMVRAAAIDVIAQPYVRAAVLRGLPARTVLWRHVLPNTAGQLVNVVAVNLVWLIGGVIVVENVFAFQGIGQRLVTAVSQGDVPTVQALAMVTGVLFLAISVAADAIVARVEAGTR
ncbi:ABC transporter permease [Conexibacter woesei]|uniref:Binding-protein-dependent transport systems inner membrane component n=1 Tax=Conexibacter woesei (strain DSM 14684 / CCUG 47730 / CIP 108061 / JCM 11494 / NBRC 100937 / ID131577) TaxID=469383 RepID=D3F4F9_CONWI|nr:ABC transporter permease [Conexibacter woesei]ADB50531.1 binding-protein-dependent transport systems inner membrane component [Conexibacter woesei DSM 14684]